MNITFPKLTQTQIIYIVVGAIVALYFFKLYKTNEKFEQEPLATKIDDIVKLLNQKEFRDYLSGLHQLNYLDEKLRKYDNYVYLKKLLKDKKLTRTELVNYFD